MELKRIIARDSRTATEKAMSLYGPDVLVIANQSIDGQTELIVAIDIEPAAASASVATQPERQAFQPMELAKPHPAPNGNMQAFEEAMAMVRNAQAASESMSQPAARQPSPYVAAAQEQETTFKQAPERAPTTANTSVWDDWVVPCVADLGAATPAPVRRRAKTATASAAATPATPVAKAKTPTNTNKKSVAKAQPMAETETTAKPAPKRRAKPAVLVADTQAMAPIHAEETLHIPGIADIAIAPRSTARRRPRAESAAAAKDLQSVAQTPAVAPKALPQPETIAATPTEQPAAPARVAAPRRAQSATVVKVSPTDEATQHRHTAPLAQAASDRSRELVDLVRAEIASLRQEFTASLKLQQSTAKIAENSAISPAIDLLDAAGVPVALRTLLIDSAQHANTPQQAMDTMRGLLEHGMQAQATSLPESGVHALIGPSGAGKSVMAARWLRQLAQQTDCDRLALISYCDQRPGAWSQTQMLAAQTGVRAYRAPDADTLKLLLDELRGHQLIVIDTPGAEPLKHAQTLKQTWPDMGMHAVLPADASQATVKRFTHDAPLIWNSVVLSKLDECDQPWALIQQLCNHVLPIAGLSNSPSPDSQLCSWSPHLLLDKALPSWPCLDDTQQITPRAPSDHTHPPTHVFAPIQTTGALVLSMDNADRERHRSAAPTLARKRTRPERVAA